MYSLLWYCTSVIFNYAFIFRYKDMRREASFEIRAMWFNLGNSLIYLTCFTLFVICNRLRYFCLIHLHIFATDNRKIEKFSMKKIFYSLCHKINFMKFKLRMFCKNIHKIKHFWNLIIKALFQLSFMLNFIYLF